MRLLAVVVLVLVACGPPSPLVEALPEGVDTGFELTAVTGERDGARTQARIELTTGAGPLVIDLLLGYDPQPELVSGSWSHAGATGSVRAESVRFVGGQGEGVSVGGVYVLEGPDGPRFRLRLPLTGIERKWSPGG